MNEHILRFMYRFPNLTKTSDDTEHNKKVYFCFQKHICAAVAVNALICSFMAFGGSGLTHLVI